MDTTTLLLFIMTVSAVIAIPGPTMLLALNNGMTSRAQVTASGIAGAALGDIALFAAVGCGLGTLLAASEQLFTLVKWAGVLYLLYLAWCLWRAPVRNLADQAGQQPAVQSSRTAFMRSLFVAVSNPKALLFVTAFVPQFIQPTGPQFVQYATLAVTAATINIAVMSVYALGGRHAMRYLSAHAERWMNRGCAGLLAGMAVAVSLYRRSESR